MNIYDDFLQKALPDKRAGYKRLRYSFIADVPDMLQHVFAARLFDAIENVVKNAAGVFISSEVDEPLISVVNLDEVH